MSRTCIIFNITNRDLLIDDLGIRVQSRKNVDLLSKSYGLTDEQIETSINSGSIFKKKGMLIRRANANLPEAERLQASTVALPARHKSLYVDETKNLFDELEIDDLNMGDDLP
jgi:hypothetical protein